MLSLHTNAVLQDFLLPEGSSASSVLRLNFSDGQYLQVSIPIVNDFVLEEEEQFTVGLLVYDQLIDVTDVNITDDDEGTQSPHP